MEKVSVAVEKIMQSTCSPSSMASGLHGALPEEEMTCLRVIPLMGPTVHLVIQTCTPGWSATGGLLRIAESENKKRPSKRQTNFNIVESLRVWAF